MLMQDFIRQYGLRMSYEDFLAGVDCFIAEMEAGLKGGKSSMKMLPTYLSLEKLSQRETRVIAMDAGGTNLRITLVNMRENKTPETEYLEVYPMPGAKDEIAAEAFFDTLAEYLAPIVDKSGRIGFCFSYPCEMRADLDGKILHMTKEVKIRGAEGLYVGEELKKALARRGLRHDHTVIVLNDTVATLLGGKACAKGREYDSYIGLILGTGINCAYVEKNTNITKEARLAASGGTCLINMESGGYDKFPRTAIDEKFDGKTMNPGKQLLEKMISGVYQGSLLLEYVRAAAGAGCFSDGFCERLSAVENLQSKEVDDFCYYPYGTGRLAALTEDSEQDKAALYQLMDAFFDRAAILSIMKLAAIMKKTGTGQNPLKPVCISAEGSTFYKSKLLHKKINYYLTAFLEERMHVCAEFMRAENATISGTSLAALQG